MNKFKTKSKSSVGISTASLPDIVFLLLFFFMVSAVIRTEEQLQKIEIPSARQLSRPEMKILIKEISIGKPMLDDQGQEPLIVADGRFVSLENLPLWIERQKATLPESLRDQMIILIRADEMVKMGLIADVQEKLRKSNARKVLYRSHQKSNSEL